MDRAEKTQLFLAALRVKLRQLEPSWSILPVASSLAVMTEQYKTIIGIRYDNDQPLIGLATYSNSSRYDENKNSFHNTLHRYECMLIDPESFNKIYEFIKESHKC